MTTASKLCRAGRLAAVFGLLVATAVAAALACSSARQATPSRPSLLSSVSAHPGYASPATWRYHPRQEAGLVARYELGSGRVLLAGKRGERWLLDKKKRATAASQLAPEDLVIVLPQAGGGFLFIGKSGTSYETSEPLGPFLRSNAPLDPVVRVSAEGSTIAAVRNDGNLVRSADAGTTWQRIGPTDERFIDVALTQGGHGFALSVPEQLWRTGDGGATWERMDVPTVGALGFDQDRDAGLVVRGVLGWYRFDQASGPLQPLGRVRATERYELPKKPPRGPDANAVMDSRAVFVGGYYLELRQDERSPSEWRLWHGRPDAALRSERISKLKDCREVKIAAYDRWVTLACHRGSYSSSAQKFVFFRSADRAKHFRREDFVARADPNSLRMAMGAKGALLLTGACPPHNPAAGCRPQGVLYRRKATLDAGAADSESDDEDGETDSPARPGRRDAGTDHGKREQPEYELALSATPALKAYANALAFSTDGRIAYAVGRRTKNQALAVFVSADGGATFEAQEIEQLGVQPDYDEEDRNRYRYGYGSSQPSRPVTTVNAAEDGSVSVVLEQSGKYVLVVADELGRVVSLSHPPGEDAKVGAVGTRAIAISISAQRAWETVDGGANWNSIGKLPLNPCPSGGRCPIAVVCYLGGCVVGEELSRLGWHGQADGDEGVLSPPVHTSAGVFVSKLRTPISCTLDEKPWQALPELKSPPEASQAAIGEAAWYAVIRDDTKASAAVLEGRGGKRPRVDTVTLLPPVKDAGRYAIAVWDQIEGAVAMRYRTPDVDTRDPRLRNVEVAWNNLLEGRLVKTRIVDAGPYESGDFYSDGEGGAQQAQSDLLSIAAGGLFVRAHQSTGTGQPTYFLDGRTISTVPPMYWPSVSASELQSEMANVGSQQIPVLLVDSGTAVVRGRREADTWVFDAVTSGLPNPSAFGLTQARSLAYVDGRSGAHVMLFDPAGKYHRAWVLPFRADGPVVDPPVPVPMQADTGDQPVRCSDRRRSNSPRVVVPFQPGTRHPVIVVDVEEPVRVLLTGRSVMHGTPESPCTAALEAGIVQVDGGPEPQGEQALVMLDDLDHSWIFRVLSDENTEQSELEYRMMSCRFDPKAHVPQDVYQAPGTRIQRY